MFYTQVMFSFPSVKQTFLNLYRTGYKRRSKSLCSRYAIKIRVTPVLRDIRCSLLYGTIWVYVLVDNGLRSGFVAVLKIVTWESKIVTALYERYSFWAWKFHSIISCYSTVVVVWLTGSRRRCDARRSPRRTCTWWCRWRSRISSAHTQDPICSTWKSVISGQYLPCTSVFAE